MEDLNRTLDDASNDIYEARERAQESGRPPEVELSQLLPKLLSDVAVKYGFPAGPG